MIKIVLKDFEDMLQAVTTEALSRFAGTYGYNLTLSVATSWYFEQIRQAATNDTPPTDKEKSKTKEDKSNGAFVKIADLKKLKTKDLKEKLRATIPSITAKTNSRFNLPGRTLGPLPDYLSAVLQLTLFSSLMPSLVHT